MLDPIERASEAIFGVLMAMTFTGSLNAATAAREEIGTMLLTAVGCNIAWGLTDAVMYLVGSGDREAAAAHAAAAPPADDRPAERPAA